MGIENVYVWIWYFNIKIDCIIRVDIFVREFVGFLYLFDLLNILVYVLLF